MVKHLIVGILAGVFFITAARADSNDERLKQLHDLYQCPIFAYLAAIHRTALQLDQRYLVVEVNLQTENYYAQCIFHNKDRLMHCEASSPSYTPKLKEYLTPDRLQVLKALGYTTKSSKNNYHLERKVVGIDSLYDIAGLIVDTLGRVFDMQLDETLTYRAPLVEQPPAGSVEGSKLCAPMISRR